MLIYLLDFDYDLLHRNIFRVYPLVSYALLSLWLGLGISALSSLVFQNKKLVLQKKLIETGFIIVITVSVFALNVKHNYRADDKWAEEYASVVLETLDQDSILFTSGDLDQNPVGYLNLVEEVRPDVELFHEKGILYSNRLFFPGRNSIEERKKIINEFILKANVPIYYTYGLPHIYGIENFGLYRRIVPEKPPNFDKSVAISEITQYFQHLLAAGEPGDPWELMHYRVLVTEYCRLSLHIMEYSEHSVDEKKHLKNWINQICHTYHGKLEYIKILLDRQQPDWSKIESLLVEANELKVQSILKSDYARFYCLRGKIFERTGDSSNAVNSYRRCQKLWPHPDNPAYTHLINLTGN